MEDIYLYVFMKSGFDRIIPMRGYSTGEFCAIRKFLESLKDAEWLISDMVDIEWVNIKDASTEWGD